MTSKHWPPELSCGVEGVAGRCESSSIDLTHWPEAFSPGTYTFTYTLGFDTSKVVVNTITLGTTGTTVPTGPGAPRVDGQSAPFSICACCGFEFRYEDCSPEGAQRHPRRRCRWPPAWPALPQRPACPLSCPSIDVDWAEKWIANGATWFDPTKRPAAGPAKINSREPSVARRSWDAAVRPGMRGGYRPRTSSRRCPVAALAGPLQGSTGRPGTRSRRRDQSWR